MLLNSGTLLNAGKKNSNRTGGNENIRKLGSLAGSWDRFVRERLQPWMQDPFNFSVRQSGTSQGGSSSVAHEVAPPYIPGRYSHRAGWW